MQSLTPNNEGEPVDPAVEADKLHKLNDTTMLTKQKATTLNVKLEAKEKTPIVHNPGETLSRSDFEVIVINSDGEEKTLSLADPWRIVPTTIPKDPASSGITSSTYYVDIWYNGLWTSVPVKVNYPGLMQTWAFVS